MLTSTTHRWRRPFFVLPAFVLALALAAAACGGGEGGPPAGETPAGETPAGETPAGETPTGPVTIDVSMRDNFFEPAEFTVKAGQEVTFNATNDGAAIHNMHVAGADNEYGTDDDVQSDPQLVDPGDTATLTWTAPDEPGVYDFQCDVHLPDMAGTITVQ